MRRNLLEPWSMAGVITGSEVPVTRRFLLQLYDAYQAVSSEFPDSSREPFRAENKHFTTFAKSIFPVFMPALASRAREKLNFVFMFSGGPDSVLSLISVLSIDRMLKDAGHGGIVGRAFLLHLDHELRERSGEDFEFTEKVASKLGLEFVGKRAGEIAEGGVDPKKTGSEEAAARELREKFLREFLKEKGRSLGMRNFVVVKGHNLDDLVETAIIRMIRGEFALKPCPFEDSVSIGRSSVPVVRPLLSMRKRWIEYILVNSGIPFRTDETNLDQKYLRNRIRKDLVPTLEKIDARGISGISESIVEACLRVRETAGLLEEEIEGLGVFGDGKIVLQIFRKLGAFKRRFVIAKALSSANISVSKSRIIEAEKFMLSREGGQHELGGGVSVVKKGRLAWFISSRDSIATQEENSEE